MKRYSTLVTLCTVLLFGLTSACGGGGGSDDGAELPTLGILWSVTDAGTPNAGGQVSVNDVSFKLFNTGLFKSIRVLDLGEAVVTPITLEDLDVVLVSSFLGVADVPTLQATLKAFLDDGGGMVAASPLLTHPMRHFQNEDYAVILNTGFNVSQAALSLGTILAPNHPILQGVDTVLGDPAGTLHPLPDVVPLAPGATLLAEWSNTAQLVAVRTLGGGGRRVDLGFLASSTDVSGVFPNGWDPNSDALRLITNALRWAAGIL